MCRVTYIKCKLPKTICHSLPKMFFWVLWIYNVTIIVTYYVTFHLDFNHT